MRSLSNNRNNAIGPWYVYANNGPSNANGNNWGGRTSPQRGKAMLCQKNLTRCLLNQPLIKGDSGRASAPLRRKARFASQSPLKKRSLVGREWGTFRPLEEMRAEMDAMTGTPGRSAA